MEMVEVGKIILRETGERIDVSYRQAKQIGRAVRERGIKGLTYGNSERSGGRSFRRDLTTLQRVGKAYPCRDKPDWMLLEPCTT